MIVEYKEKSRQILIDNNLSLEEKKTAMDALIEDMAKEFAELIESAEENRETNELKRLERLG